MIIGAAVKLKEGNYTYNNGEKIDNDATLYIFDSITVEGTTKYLAGNVASKQVALVDPTTIIAFVKVE